MKTKLFGLVFIAAVYVSVANVQFAIRAPDFWATKAWRK